MSGNDSGLYAVALSINKTSRKRIGALGILEFEQGVYIYVGSAKRSLSKRVARHRKRIKPLRWHIDYLRKTARWEGAVAFTGSSGECSLARDIEKCTQGAVLHPRFGASDCLCPGHLIYSGSDAAVVLEKLENLRFSG